MLIIIPFTSSKTSNLLRCLKGLFGFTGIAKKRYRTPGYEIRYQPLRTYEIRVACDHNRDAQNPQKSGQSRVGLSKDPMGRTFFDGPVTWCGADDRVLWPQMENRGRIQRI